MSSLALAASLASLVALASLPAAQLREEKHSPLGITVAVPKAYEPIPVRPNEPWIVLRYADQKDPARHAIQPELFVLRIDWKQDPEPVPEPPPITTLARFFEQRMKDWVAIEERETKPREPWKSKEYDLEIKGIEENRLVARAFELRGDQRTWAVLGFCDRDDVDKHARLWRQCFDKLEFFEPTAVAEAEKWRRFYARHPELKNPEYRIAVRSGLVDGWDSEDTPNYVWVYSTQKSVLMRDVQKKLEGIRKRYVELFPPAADITAVSTARVCKDEEEYHAYGGPDRTAGYWNAQGEELVFYDAGKEDTRIVLYHEAFHQYVYYAVGELDPHMWFNEGYGDYFSGAEFNTYGDLIKIHPNPWRVEWIQRKLGECDSWSDIIRMDREKFYDPERRAIHYAMAWSMIYFLEESKEVERMPAWQRILPTYYETFRSGWTREKKRLESEGKAQDKEAVAKAGAEVREEAVSAAFKGVDLREIERVWGDFVLGLKLPK